MRKTIGAMLGAGLLALAAGAAPAAADDGHGGDGVTVMVMKHLCNSDIQSLEDFNEVKALGGDNPVAQLAQTVLACPTIVNPGDETSDIGIKGDATEFAFTLEDAAGVSQLPQDTMPSKLCESDLGLDADGDGEVGEVDVCLDTTHYVFEGVQNGHVTIRETDPPAGYEFGELLFTPTVIDGNNDADTLASLGRDSGVISLDTAADEDGTIMLHIYNFESDMPDTSVIEADQGAAPSLLALFGLGGFAALAAVYGLRRRSATTEA
jgi:hypothetical protein